MRMMSNGRAPRAGRREWTGLAVLALPTMLVSLDLSVLFLALPHLSVDLRASGTQQLWITDIYGFMIAGFLITMGNVGDRIGRRRLLLLGAAGFGAVSVLAAFSESPVMLIVARALLGIAGSTQLPSILALIRTMFPDPRQMGTAIAVWTTAFMAGVALGPVVGGALLDHFWWGSVFLMGVPVMLLLLILGPTLLPEFRAPVAGRIDLTSVVLSLATILSVIYGLKQVARDGWETLPLVAVVVGAVFGAAFVVRQRRLRDPLLDLRLFTIRAFSVALVIGLLVASVQSGNTMLVTMHLQLVEGFSPLVAGLWLVPPALGLILATNLAPVLARRFRPAHLLAAGLFIAVTGYVLVTRVPRVSGLAVLIAGITLVYVGLGPIGTLINQLALGAAPAEKAGSAAAVASTSGELGLALGIATLGSLAGVVYRANVNVPAEVTGTAARQAQDSAGGAMAVAGQLDSPLGVQLLESAQAAFTTALHIVAGVSAVLFVALAILVVTSLRHINPIGTTQPGDEAEDAAAPTEHPSGMPAEA